MAGIIGPLNQQIIDYNGLLKHIGQVCKGAYQMIRSGSGFLPDMFTTSIY